MRCSQSQALDTRRKMLIRSQKSFAGMFGFHTGHTEIFALLFTSVTRHVLRLRANRSCCTSPVTSHQPFLFPYAKSAAYTIAFIVALDYRRCSRACQFVGSTARFLKKVVQCPERKIYHVHRTNVFGSMRRPGVGR